MARRIIYHPAQDYYELLNIDSRASAADIRRAYRERVLLVHPDRNPQREEWATAQIQLLNAAYDVLRNPDLRRDYDERRRLFRLKMRQLATSAQARSADVWHRHKAGAPHVRHYWLWRNLFLFGLALLVVSFTALRIGLEQSRRESEARATITAQAAQLTPATGMRLEGYAELTGAASGRALCAQAAALISVSGDANRPRVTRYRIADGDYQGVPIEPGETQFWAVRAQAITVTLTGSHAGYTFHLCDSAGALLRPAETGAEIVWSRRADAPSLVIFAVTLPDTAPSGTYDLTLRAAN